MLKFILGYVIGSIATLFIMCILIAGKEEE